MKRAKWLIAFTALALVAAACGSGDSDTTVEAGTPTTQGVVTSIVTQTSIVTEILDREPITVMASWGGDEQSGFLQVLNAFTAATGLPWVYEGQRDLVTVLQTRIAGGNAPDLAMIPRPGFLAAFVEDDVVVPICCGMAMTSSTKPT